MANTYDNTEVYKIEFTEDDIKAAVEAMNVQDKNNTVATLTANMLSGGALITFGELAVCLKGKVCKLYGSLEIMVPKTESELADHALYHLRFYGTHAELRDQRAEEQGIEPKQA
jgi:hypothetical protein